MRATSLLAIVALFVSHTATADVKRHKSIPEPVWGSWAPSVEACNKDEKSIIALAAKSYVSPEASCTIDWVSETCPFRKFHPAWIRIVRQNHRILISDACDPACARNACR